MRILSFPFAAAVFGALASAASAPANAGLIAKTKTQNAATSCTLSIPSTDTKVRPKANGYRNEGTTNQYVICGFDIDSTDPGFLGLSMVFASFDGAAHTFNCTAMSRNIEEQTGQYLTSAVTTSKTGTATRYEILTSDPATYDLYPWGQSVTCILPPGVSILGVQSFYNDEDSVT